jgi:hypothetical protein
MKKIVYSLFVIAITLSNSNLFFAQKNKGLKSIGDVPSEKYNGQWGGFDVGFLMTNATNEWENNVGKSAAIGLNVFEFKIPLIKQYLGLTTGLGVNLRTYSFANQYSLISNDTSVFMATGNPTLYDPNSSIRYSQLNQGFIQIPLLLDFSTKQREKKAFSIAAGVVGGLRMYSTQRLNGKYSNNDKFNIVVRDDKRFHTNLFALDATVRISYGSFGLFGTYGLVDLFQKDAVNTKINPITFGISFNVDYFEED